MKAVRVHEFGGLDTIVYEDAPRPIAGEGQVLVHVRAAGVGPWDALIRSGKSRLCQPLPLTLGSDLAGVVEEIGPGGFGFLPGDEVFGVTNARFTGACAEYAAADAARIARKPAMLNYVEAASVPVVACTAWQMVFDYGQVNAAKRVLVHGGAGNVGAYAIHLARWAGAEVIATAFARDEDYVRSLGADQVIDAGSVCFEDRVGEVDVVVDTVGGETLDRSFEVVKFGGVLTSAADTPDPQKMAQRSLRGGYFLVSVTTGVLAQMADLLDTGQVTTHVGEVLPLAEARRAHEMLAGQLHSPGKIVLQMEPQRHKSNTIGEQS